MHQGQDRRCHGEAAEGCCSLSGFRAWSSGRVEAGVQSGQGEASAWDQVPLKQAWSGSSNDATGLTFQDVLCSWRRIRAKAAGSGQRAAQLGFCFEFLGVGPRGGLPSQGQGWLVWEQQLGLGSCLSLGPEPCDQELTVTPAWVLTEQRLVEVVPDWHPRSPSLAPRDDLGGCL